MSEKKGGNRKKVLCGAAACFVVVALAIGLGVGLGLYYPSGQITMSFADGTKTVGRRRALRFADIGSANSSQVQSMQWLLLKVQLCNKITTTGTASQANGQCFTLFQSSRSDDNAFYTNFNAQVAMDPTDTYSVEKDYVDLMTSSGRAKLNRGIPFTAAEAAMGPFNYVLINWARPVKFQCTIPINSTNSVYSKTPLRYPAAQTDSNTGIKMVNVVTGPSLEGPSELSVADLPNGGSWARLMTPFSPLINGAYKFTLAFNPDGIITSSGPSGSTVSCNLPDPVGGFPIVTDTCGISINVPMIPLSPIIHQASDHVKKESYTISCPIPSSYVQEIRHEMYYVDGETTFNYRAVDSMGKFVPGQSMPGNTFATFELDHNADDTYTFKTWCSQCAAPADRWLDGFKRLTTVGASGSANFSHNCQADQSGTVQAGCTAIPCTYTLDSVVEVDFSTI